MNKNKIFLGVKVLLVIAFLSYVAYEILKSKSELQMSAGSSNFFSKEILNPMSLKIISGNRTIVLQNKNKDWYLDEPFQSKANRKLIDSWLNRILKSKVEAMPQTEEAVDWFRYGLDNPLATLTFNLKDKPKIIISLGIIKNFQDRYYLKFVQGGEERLLTTDLKLLNFVLLRPEEFLNKANILSLDPEEVKALDFNSLLKVAKDKDNLWVFESDSISQDFDLDPAKAKSYLQELEDLDVVSFEPDLKLVNLNISKFLFTVNIKFKDKDPSNLIFTGRTKNCGNNELCRLLSSSDSKYLFWIKDTIAQELNPKSFFVKDE